MAIELFEDESSNVIEVHVTEKLNRAEYQILVPQTEAAIKKHGKIRVLFVMHEFHGWTAGAAWEDIKFDLKHFNHIDRLAFVGDSKWEQGMAAFCRPFTTARIRYFGGSELEQARNWINAPAAAPA